MQEEPAPTGPESKDDATDDEKEVLDASDEPENTPPTEKKRGRAPKKAAPAAKKPRKAAPAKKGGNVVVWYNPHTSARAGSL